jgi:hypothetical protein
VQMLRAQDAQEQPFAGGNEAAVRKKRLGDFFPMLLVCSGPQQPGQLIVRREVGHPTETACIA